MVCTFLTPHTGKPRYSNTFPKASSQPDAFLPDICTGKFLPPPRKAPCQVITGSHRNRYKNTVQGTEAEKQSYCLGIEYGGPENSVRNRIQYKLYGESRKVTCFTIHGALWGSGARGMIWYREGGAPPFRPIFFAPSPQTGILVVTARSIWYNTPDWKRYR